MKPLSTQSSLAFAVLPVTASVSGLCSAFAGVIAHQPNFRAWAGPSPGASQTFGSSVAVVRLDWSAQIRRRRIAVNGEPVEREVGELPLNEHIARKVDDDRMRVTYEDARPFESSGREFIDVARRARTARHDVTVILWLGLRTGYGGKVRVLQQWKGSVLAIRLSPLLLNRYPYSPQKSKRIALLSLSLSLPLSLSLVIRNRGSEQCGFLRTTCRPAHAARPVAGCQSSIGSSVCVEV